MALNRCTDSTQAIAESLGAKCVAEDRKRISVGMFWFRREDFEAVKGFDENLDFALRLRAYGRQRNQKYATVWRHGIRTSCRKFDQFGDWYLVRNPSIVRRIMTGQDQAAANIYYYDVDRGPK